MTGDDGRDLLASFYSRPSPEFEAMAKKREAAARRAAAEARARGDEREAARVMDAHFSSYAHKAAQRREHR